MTNFDLDIESLRNLPEIHCWETMSTFNCFQDKSAEPRAKTFVVRIALSPHCNPPRCHQGDITSLGTFSVSKHENLGILTMLNTVIIGSFGNSFCRFFFPDILSIT